MMKLRFWSKQHWYVLNSAYKHRACCFLDTGLTQIQVAKDPPEFEEVPGITEPEKEAIRNEVLHKWRQPRSLYFTIILCSIGAAVQGW